MKPTNWGGHGDRRTEAERSDDNTLRVKVKGANVAWRSISRHGPEVAFAWALLLLFLAVSGPFASAANAPLKISVYCTAGDVQQHLDTPAARERVLRTLEPLRVSRLFLEGRRGDEYVSPTKLREIRDDFLRHGIKCSGGIATVPGARFGVRQTGGLDWLNWESPKSRADVAGFFTENAPLFDEIIVDDFYCTGDISPESDRARGNRSWAEYRQDLLVSLIEPMIVQPTRAAKRRTKLILKYPQWYDRFHLFGYDPPRMSAPFETIWVGTEVRDPQTRRMGFVQPTEGYMNFLWLKAIAGKKVRGAWFDHIECSAQNFVDQAYQSVLAGAQELTLFRLGDLMAPHPGDALLAERLPALRELASRIRGKSRRGLAFYKPPGSESSENMYLADYLGMLGLPILPVADYPKDARAAFLPVQAAADANLIEKMARHLKGGATLIVTPALLKQLGPESLVLAGVELLPGDVTGLASRFEIEGMSVDAEVPVELGARLKSAGGAVQVTAAIGEQRIPILTRHRVGRGQVFVLNLRTFSEEDFGKQGEWLLAPRPLGLSDLPQALADRIRLALLSPLGVQFQSPSGVGLVLFGKEACAYSFLDQPAQVRFGAEAVDLSAHGLVWLK
jgi:hypothetical protein